jgi:hypothetical protein
LGAAAQAASGNVAESSHPRTAVLQAQNPRIHRTVEGCIAQQGGEYALQAKHLGLIHLRGGMNDTLSQHVGKRVKVRGNLVPLPAQDADEEKPAAAPDREMTVEQIKGASGSCPVN